LDAGSTNYVVFLKSYEVPPRPTDSAVALIEKALGTAVTLGGIEEVQSESVWPEVENALLYAGDHGAGPSDAAIKSEKLAALIVALKDQINELVKTATKIESFWLQDGHPAYPVFCDFAFLFRGDASVTIFMGSSSD
jgi:hypothetical protein